MKTLKIILVVILLFNIISCHPSCCVNISAFVNLKVLDTQGRNLLDSPAIYTKSNIEIYNVINGHAQINLGSINAPLIYKDVDGSRSMRVFLHYDKNEKTSLTLIKFGDTKTDTIAGEFKYSGNSVSLLKVWFNGMLKSYQFVVLK